MGTIIIAILVLAVVLGAVGYYVFFMRPKDPNAEQESHNDNKDVSMDDADTMMAGMDDSQGSMPEPPTSPTPEQNMDAPEQPPAQSMDVPDQAQTPSADSEPMQPTGESIEQMGGDGAQNDTNNLS